MILTDEEITALKDRHFVMDRYGESFYFIGFARDVESAVREKLKQQEPSSDLDVLRRIAERGLNHYQAKFDSVGVDLFQHMLDEITRVQKVS